MSIVGTSIPKDTVQMSATFKSFDK